MSLLMMRAALLAQGRNALPPGPPADTPVRFDTSAVPANYTLVAGDTGYARTGTASDYRRWLRSDRVLGLLDANADPTRWYWEVELTGGQTTMGGYIGVVEESWWHNNDNGSDHPIGGGSLGYGGAGAIWGNGGANLTSTPASYGAGDVLMLAFIPFTGELWVGRNGVWTDNPATDSATAVSVTPGANFRLSAQGRGPGDSGLLRSRLSDFDHPMPAGFLPLATPNPRLARLAARSLGGYAILGRRPGVMNARHLNAYLIVEDGTE